MTEVERQARRWVAARDRERRERAGLVAVVRSSAEQGTSEMELVRQSKLARSTIRKWLGK